MPDDSAPLKADESPPLERRISFRISRLHARLNAQAARILRDGADISLTQWRVMVMIERFGQVTASEIVRQTKMDKALISRTIRSLTDLGLVETVTSASDQRAQLLRFTVAGFARFESAWPRMLARNGALAAALTKAEMAGFLDTLDRIEAAAEVFDAAGAGGDGVVPIVEAPSL